MAPTMTDRPSAPHRAAARSRATRARLIGQGARFAATVAPDVTPVIPLSEREVEVARAVADGLTNHEIGDRLYISLSTVKTHIASVQTKLGVRNRVEIAAWAWRSGLMTP